MRKALSLLSLVALLGTAPLGAQGRAKSYFIDIRGGFAVPTFGIADIIKPGGAFGVGFGYQVDSGVALLADLDMGYHKQKNADIDSRTMHAIAKMVWPLLSPSDQGFEIGVNVGAGIVRFRWSENDATTHFAVNVGAKIVYHINGMFALLISPQGDVAFGKELDPESSSAFVWPFTMGIRVKV